MTVNEFLEANCFHCKRLNARITPQCCRQRQKAEIKMLVVLKKTLPEDMRANEFCASGACKEGRRHR